jgi:hypothetical protein
MPLVDLKVKHGRKLPEAQGLMEKAVNETKARFGLLIQKVNWAEDRNAVTLSGIGFEVRLQVDNEEVHVQGDFPFLGNLIGGPMVTGLKGIIQEVFQKKLTVS